MLSLTNAAFYESNAICWVGTGYDQSTQHSPGCLPEILTNKHLRDHFSNDFL